MTLMRIQGYAVIAMALLSAGCGLFGSSEPASPANTNSSATAATSSPLPRAQTQTPVDFDGAKQLAQSASDKVRPPNRSSRPATVSAVKKDIQNAIKKLKSDKDSLEEQCIGCSEETTKAAVQALDLLIRAEGKLDTDSDQVSQLDRELKTSLERDLADAVLQLNNADSAFQKTQQTTSVNASANQNDNANSSTRQAGASTTGGEETGWWGMLLWALYGMAGILLLVLIAVAFTFLWKSAWRTVEKNISSVVSAHVSAVRDAQPDYEQRLSTLSSTQREINNRLTELDTEVRSLARLVRESLANRNDRRSLPLNYQPQFEDFIGNEEPEFPVSAVDYLGKMDRYANVVRPDFQNGILVNDPDGRGELVLIRDSRSFDDNRPLFVVPRATQFQTKQDFYTYYQKYYNCDKPSAGDVWIIGPAVVEKVAGGWQLREKGMLEVR